MKKLLRVVLVFGIILSIISSSFAVDYSEGTVTNTYKINEYEAVKNLAEKTPAVLTADGYGSAEIAGIKNYKNIFLSHIEELNKLSNASLASNGYSQYQIDIIRNFTGSEEEIAAVSAELTITATVANFQHITGGRTTCRFGYNWEWNVVPAFKSRDILAIAWNDWNVLAQRSEIMYVDRIYGNPYTTGTATYVEYQHGTHGVSHHFKVGLNDSEYYAKRGSGSFDIESSELVKKDLHWYIEYGHTQIVVSEPSVSIGIGSYDGVINFSLGTVGIATLKGEKRW